MVTPATSGLAIFTVEFTTPKDTEAKPLIVPLVFSFCVALPLLLVAIYLFWRWKTGKKVFPFCTNYKTRPIRKKVSIEIPENEQYSEIEDRKSISLKTAVNGRKSISIINDNQKQYNTNMAFVDDNTEDYFSDFQTDIDDFYIVLEKDSTMFPSSNALKLELMHDITLDDESVKVVDTNEHSHEVSPKHRNNTTI